jgi:hypothetical protein
MAAPRARHAVDFRADLPENILMKVELPLQQMTTDEKLQAMELLWADLSRLAPDETVPGWHRHVLAERERRFEAGDERELDWSEVKRDLQALMRDSKDS